MASMHKKLVSRDGSHNLQPTDLTRKIQVIGCGWGRTGTMSFNAALEKLLNGPSFHSGTKVVQSDEAQLKIWNDILSPNAEPEFIKTSLESMLAGHVGCTDTWLAAFTPELCELYPEALVVCTVRDQNTWWESFQAVSTGGGNDTLVNAVLWPVPRLRLSYNALEKLWKRLSRNYNIDPPTRPTKDFLNYHTAWLKRVVPTSRLHFFNVKDGWEPLCKMLNVPIPDEPFPRVNERSEIRALGNEFLWIILKAWARIAIWAVGWIIGFNALARWIWYGAVPGRA